MCVICGPGAGVGGQSIATITQEPLTHLKPTCALAMHQMLLHYLTMDSSWASSGYMEVPPRLCSSSSHLSQDLNVDLLSVKRTWCQQWILWQAVSTASTRAQRTYYPYHPDEVCFWQSGQKPAHAAFHRSFRSAPLVPLRSKEEVLLLGCGPLMIHPPLLVYWPGSEHLLLEPCKLFVYSLDQRTSTPGSWTGTGLCVIFYWPANI